MVFRQPSRCSNMEIRSARVVFSVAWRLKIQKCSVFNAPTSRWPKKVHPLLSSELEVYEVFGIGEHASLGSISCIDYPCTTFFLTANEIMLPTDYPNMLRFGENPLQLLITCYLQLLKINRLRGRHQPRCHPSQLGHPTLAYDSQLDQVACF
jgi:hypothetical protein